MLVKLLPQIGKTLFGKDQTFYREAVVKMPGGEYNYDLIKHKALDVQYHAENKD